MEGKIHFFISEIVIEPVQRYYLITTRTVDYTGALFNLQIEIHSNEKYQRPVSSTWRIE